MSLWRRPSRIAAITLIVAISSGVALFLALRASPPRNRPVVLADPTDSPTGVVSPTATSEPTRSPSPSEGETIAKSGAAPAPDAHVEANGASKKALVSSSGRYVVFRSAATNLTSDATDAQWGIYRRDRVDDRTILVSRSLSGDPLETAADLMAISDDGNVVAYLVYSGPAAYDERTDEQVSRAVALYVSDVADAATKTVELPRDVSELGGMFLSTDGRYATVSMGPYRSGMVYLLDLVTGDSTPVSVSSEGIAGNDNSWGGSMSSDHRYVVFDSDATNLVPGDTNDSRDVFLRDTVARTTTRISVAPNGDQLAGYNMDGLISGDGGSITFDSSAADFGVEPTCPIPENQGFSYTPYLLERESGALRSLYDENSKACHGVWAISKDGKRLLMSLGYGREGILDLHTHSMSPTPAAAACPADEPGLDEAAPHPDMSADALVVVAPTVCALSSSDHNDVEDVYAIEMATGAIERVSVPDGG